MATELKQVPRTDAATTEIPNTAPVTDALARVLSDTYRLLLKTHTYHWNVTGPMFYSIHEMTEAQYTDMFAAADELAERIRALGKLALVGSVTGSGPNPETKLTAGDMVKDLLSDHEHLAREFRALVETAEVAGDPVTADLATGRAAFHEKSAWMYRATAA